MKISELEQLMTAHRQDIMVFLCFLGATPTEAEDVAQETFVSAYRNLFSPPVSSPHRCYSWLRGIARNIFLKRCRKARRDPVVVDAQWTETAERFWAAEVATGEDGAQRWRQALKHCLEQLPNGQQELIHQRYTERMSYRDMASNRESTEDSVKSLLRRIRLALSKCIRTRMNDEVNP